jgi:hypothetical protein
MTSKSTGNDVKKVSFASNVKGKTGGAPTKHPSDMTAFERIAYVQSLDFEKEEQKAAEEVDEDFEDGKLTKDVAKRFLSIHFRSLKYRLKLKPRDRDEDPSRRQASEALQTSILKEEVTSRDPELMRVVQCLERGEGNTHHITSTHVDSTHHPTPHSSLCRQELTRTPWWTARRASRCTP